MSKVNLIRKKVRQVFPSCNEDNVMEILNTYGKETYQKEKERVQLAILKLCDEGADKFEHYLECAKQDYRDVLYWAEYPTQAKVSWNADITVKEKKKWLTKIKSSTNRGLKNINH